MPSQLQFRESWKQMVLRSLPAPKWLDEDGEDRDVAISTRFRAARNLKGHRFPHHAQRDALTEVLKATSPVLEKSGMLRQGRLSPTESDFLIGCRLISHEFQGSEPNRALWLNKDRSLSVMVNEEDHLRLQSIHPGWAPYSSYNEVKELIKKLEQNLDFAYLGRNIPVTASVSNFRSSYRLSALFHLIALSHRGQMKKVISALANTENVVRGLFGESSRAVGAFFQVSSTSSNLNSLVGTGEYLIKEERLARANTSREELSSLCEQAVAFSARARELSLGEAFWILGLFRWGVSQDVFPGADGLRQIDHWMSTLEVTYHDPARSADRAREVRQFAEALTKGS